MTKKTRNLILSAAILVILILAVVVMRLPDAETSAGLGAGNMTPEENPNVVVLADTVPEKLRKVAIVNPSGGMEMSSMDGETWLVSDLEDEIRVNPTLQRSVISALSRINGRLIDAEPGDLSLFGLDNPEAEALTVDVDGQQNHIVFGNENPSGNGRYAMRIGDPAVYIVPLSNANTAFWTVENLRDHGLPQVNFEEIVSLTLRAKGREFRAVPYSGELGPFRRTRASMDVVSPWKSRQLVEDYKLREFLADYPPPERVASFPESSISDPESVGIGPDSDLIEIGTADGMLYRLEIGDIAGNGLRYARETSDLDTIFLVETSRLGLLEIRPFDLTMKFVFLAGIDYVSSVEVSAPAGRVDLAIERRGDPDDDSDDLFTINASEIGEKDFKKAYQAIIGLIYEGVAENPVPVSEPELIIDFRHIEPGVPIRRIGFLPYDDTYYAVSLDGEIGDFIIGRYQIQSMLESLNEHAGT